MLTALRKSPRRKALADRLHAEIVARSRAPVFFLRLGVADTLDGRLDLLFLHGWLALERLKAAGLDAVSQALVNAIFVNFDEGLRELGAGDIGIGHRVKKIASAFYGRMKAYDAAADAAALADAVWRNVYRGDAAHRAQAQALAFYAASARAALAQSDPERHLDFGPLPE